MIKKILKFYDEIKQEALKVVWPSKQELIGTSLVVIAAIFICSICCLVVDYGIHSIIQFCLKI